MKRMPFSAYETSVPVAVGKLASSLHANRSVDLAIDCRAVASGLSDSMSQGLWQIVGDQIEFSSLKARNQCSAVDAFRELLTRSNEIHPENLFEAAHALWRDEIGHADFASGRLLALASCEVNILQAAANLITSGEQRVFDVLHSVEVALPHLPSISIDDLIAVTTAQHPKTKNDLAGGMLFGAIEKALLPQPSLAWALYRHLKSDLSEATANLYCTSLMVLASTEYRDEAIASALDDANSALPLVASVAIWVVARLMRSDIQNLELRVRCTQAVRDTINHQNIEVKQSAIRALSHAAVAHTELLDDILNLTRTNDQYVLAIVADFLYMNFDAVKDHEVFPELVSALTHLGIETARGVDSFDSVLCKLVKNEQYIVLASKNLTAWVINNGNVGLRDKDFIEHFDQTIRVISGKPELLARIVTEWLAADQMQLVAAARGLISFLWVRGFKYPTFSKAVLDRLDATDLKCLARRMLGHVIWEEPILTLTFSLLNTENAPQRTFGLVHALLCQEVGRDYPKKTLEEINRKSETAQSELKELLQSAHAELSAREKAIEELPLLLEFRPPLQLRRAISLRKSREMRKSMDDADDKSIFRQIATTVSLKAGIGCFAIQDGEIGATHRMQSISHQVSLPRRSFIDPVGYAITGLGYRIAKRSDK